MSDSVKEAIIMVVAVLFVIGAIVGISAVGINASDASSRRDCEALGEDTGSRTQYRDNSCLIEIAPDLFVDVRDIKYYLDHVKPVREVDE